MSDDESGSTIELNRRRILAGLGTIGVASAGAGAGTMALFSDTETSSGNAVQAGTLDLEGPSGGSVSTAFDIGEKKPGDLGSDSFDIVNGGSLEGSLDLTLEELSTTDGGDADDLPTSENELTGALGSEGFTPNYGDESAWFHLQGDLDFGEDVTTTVDFENNEITVSYPTADFDNFSLVVDSDDDGVADQHVIYQPGGGNTDGDGFANKTTSGSGWSDRSSGLPDGVSAESGDGEITLDFSGVNGGDGLASTIAVGGLASYEEVSGVSDQWLTVPLAPGFYWGDGSSEDYVTITDGSARGLADVMDVTVTLDDGEGTTDKVVTGKPGRIMDHYDTNWTMSDGAEHSVEVGWVIPPNAGNLIQGDSVSFDITAELNQEDSQ